MIKLKDFQPIMVKFKYKEYCFSIVESILFSLKMVLLLRLLEKNLLLMNQRADIILKLKETLMVHPKCTKAFCALSNVHQYWTFHVCVGKWPVNV